MSPKAEERSKKSFIQASHRVLITNNMSIFKISADYSMLRQVSVNEASEVTITHFAHTSPARVIWDIVAPFPMYQLFVH